MAYGHPFCDGNGRTARALFYRSLLRDGYWLAPYISISNELKKNRKAYDHAYLAMETCHLDTTYCILVNLEAFHAGVLAFDEHLLRQSKKTTALREQFKKQLNQRQLALMEHTLRHANYHYTIQEHQRWHQVSPNTARTDLMDLTRKKYLAKQKHGRALSFVSTGLFQRFTRNVEN